MRKQFILEILTWNSAAGVDDSSMINAMKQLSEDTSILQGYIKQDLYKDSNEKWVCVYYWETAQNAYDSNESVADKPSFQFLMSLIKENSVTMEVMTSLQTA